MKKDNGLGTGEMIEETIGSFLIRRLGEMGLKHLFGIAGDFNLEFLDQVEADPNLTWVGCCNELNASYAADGHARTLGLAALVTTYGVGELSALCGVAGAYAEHVPVIHIVGAPPLGKIKQHAVMHHTMGEGEYGDMKCAAGPFSIAQARIEPETAVLEIDRCLRACVLQKRPVYLQLPSDLAYVKVLAPSAPLSVMTTASDPDMLQDFVQAASAKIRAAKTIAMLVDADVARYGQSDAVIGLAKHLGAPVAVMGTAKAVIDETCPNYIGVYSGAASKPHVKDAIESADCLLLFGVRFADSTTASFSQSIHATSSIKVEAWRASVALEADFDVVAMSDAISGLMQETEQREAWERKSADASRDTQMPVDDSRIQQTWFWRRIADFLLAEDVVIAENGTSLSGVTGLTMPAGVTVISQALWGSIGYSLPACFGSMMAAPQRRHLLFIGDGSFQLTAQELSSVLRHHLKPIIFLLNNDGYTIERLILGDTATYNDIQPWKYSALCEVFADETPFISCRVTTQAELEQALAQAEHADQCCFIEVVMERMDAPQSLKKLGPIYAEQDYGRSWKRRAAQTTAKQ